MVFNGTVERIIYFTEKTKQNTKKNCKNSFKVEKIENARNEGKTFEISIDFELEGLACFFLFG